MDHKLNQWILDSVALDIKSAYNKQQELPGLYEFEARYGDFYINLLTKIMSVLHDSHLDNDVKKKEYLSLAKGLLTFSNEVISVNFYGVNINENQLYAAVLFYLADYNAIAGLIASTCDYSTLKTTASKWLYTIVSSGKVSGDESEAIQKYLCCGDSHMFNSMVETVNRKNREFSFESVDDYYDTTLLGAVLTLFTNSNLRRDLYDHDAHTNWDAYIRYSVDQHIFSLLPSQRDALEHGFLSYNKSFALQMPTSAGKSYLTELLIYREIKANSENKVLYLAPLRSLGHELKLKYRKVSKALGFSYRCMYGGSNYTMTESYLKEAQLFITTPETFMSLEGAIDDLISSFSLVICDEGQLIDTAQRGPGYEMLLTRLKKQPKIRFLFVSAIIPNIDVINEWLGGQKEEIGKSEYRPCTISIGKAIYSDGRFNMEIYEKPYSHPDFYINGFIETNRATKRLTKELEKCCALALQSLNAGPVMLYNCYKHGKMGCDKYGEEILRLISTGCFPIPKDFIDTKKQVYLQDMLEYVKFQFGNEYSLSRCLSCGFAVHTADLLQNIREVIEKGFADKVIPLVVCTSTLAEGVNFPIKTLVLANIQDPTAPGTYMRKDSLMNVIGRAGRAGKERYGMVLVTGSNAKKWDLVINAANGNRLPLARGFMSVVLSKIETREQTLHRDIYDAELEEVMDAEKLAGNIDQMILRSSDNHNIENVHIDDIAEGSLVSYLGNEHTKDLLRRMFRLRYNHLLELCTNPQYSKYKDLGLTQRELDILNRHLDPVFCLSALNIEDLAQRDWISWLMGELSAISPGMDKELYASILHDWMNGKQLIEIADQTDGQSVEKVINIVNKLTYDIMIKSRQIIQYWCVRMGVENTAFDSWSILLEMGLNSQVQILMLSRGLGDRIALHAMAPLANNLYNTNDDKSTLYEKMTTNREIRNAVERLLIPNISKQYIRDYLG